jgi:hypothetical protein
MTRKLLEQEKKMETYQPIYDAVRSRISNGDIGAAVEQAMRDANFAHHAEMAANAVHCAAAEYERPSVMFRPKVYIDGDQWCALYGDNLQDGVAGFGDTPDKAMRNFDLNWCEQKAPRGGE